jgi:hypothetical protein
MGDSLTSLPPRGELRTRYRVRLLADAAPTRGGVMHREGEAERLLAWGEVLRASAAEVGEPQGVRTIVFDLVLELEAGACVVGRFDAEPGEAAVEVARQLAAGLPPERLGASIKSLAADGSASDWYPDLEAFEEAALRGLFPGEPTDLRWPGGLP